MPPIAASTPEKAGRLSVLYNNALTGPSCGGSCQNPSAFVSASETSYTTRSLCTGRSYGHPLYKRVNPKQTASDCVGNPCNPATGAKYLTETDFESGFDAVFVFKRYYNSHSLPRVRDFIGTGWRHSLLSTIDRVDVPDEQDPQIIIPTASITRPSGQILTFTKPASVWEPDADIHSTLEEVMDSGVQIGWLYVDATNRREYFSMAGYLVSVVTPDGKTMVLTYDGDKKLISVDMAGVESLTFTYDGNSRISTITDQASRVWTYQYDGNNNLEYVHNPDSTTRRYHYEDGNFPNSLTGITDERGIRYATYAYDNENRAILSTHAGDAQRVDLSYNDVDGSRTVTNSRGGVTTYTTAVQFGVRMVTGVSGPGCVTCGSTNASYTYDPSNSNMMSKTVDGVTTQYGNYDSKGQYGYKIEAVGTAQQRRKDYTYDARFYNKVTSIAEPSVYAADSTVQCAVGVDCKVTSYTYDAYGNATQQTISGYDPQGTPVIRTTTWQYNGPLNQLSQVDGPRTNVSDITFYRYYADDPSQGNNRARLKEIEDASGVLVRSNIQYSATGKVVSEQRPNGLTLAYSYYAGNDRLETLTETDTVASKTRVTRWTYLATGEVASVTSGYGTADSTTLSFDYDNARRLVKITDGLGNYIEYTLDNEGNRTDEKTYNNSAVLQRQITRTFDTYNRLDVISQANESMDYDYLPDGTLDKTTDGNSRVTDFNYDSLKRLILLTQDYGGGDPTTAYAGTQYEYNSQGQPALVVDPVGGETTFDYDDLGNLLTQTSPDSGTTTSTYDAAGNRVSKTDAKSQSFS
ncbi:MAG: DUF6531 domain-containing protein, partial [Chromatiales bacterium]